MISIIITTTTIPPPITGPTMILRLLGSSSVESKALYEKELDYM